MAERQKGPIEILCDEIGFRFEPQLECPDMLVAFVRMLVSNIEEDRALRSHIAHVTETPLPSKGSGEVLACANDMLSATEVSGLIAAAAKVHDLAGELNPECAYPTDHLIDMLSSCASAIRFGLETPCQSRHAAAAATHIWGRRYGIRLQDEFTSAWRKDWTRAQLQRAILLRLSAAIAKAGCV